MHHARFFKQIHDVPQQIEGFRDGLGKRHPDRNPSRLQRFNILFAIFFAVRHHQIRLERDDFFDIGIFRAAHRWHALHLSDGIDAVIGASNQPTAKIEIIQRFGHTRHERDNPLRGNINRRIVGA
jgi:hypothetical protein